MKKFLFSLVVVFTMGFSFAEMISAQVYHFQEGFSDTPEGWTLTNTYLTSSESNCHNEFDGVKAVKMKGTESSIETSAYETANEFSCWVKPVVDGATLIVEKSTDNGNSWNEVSSLTATAGDLEVYQKFTATVDDESELVIIKVTCAGGGDGDAIFYIDDISLTKQDAPVDDPSLAEISINNSAIEGFSKDVLEYAQEIFYTTNVVVTAIANNPNAEINIAQPENLFGDDEGKTATITVTSEDKTATATYKVKVVVTDYLYKTGYVIEGEAVVQEPGWTTDKTYTTSNIPGPGNNGVFEGDAAFKFVRGQEDKQGFLQTPKYLQIKQLSFYMMIEAFNASAKIDIKTKTGYSAETTLATINASDLKDDEWTLFTYDVDFADSTYILFFPTLPTDGDARNWMDDLSIKTTISSTNPLVAHSSDNTNVDIFPNPTTGLINISSEIIFNKARIISVTGTVLEEISLNGSNTIDISHLNYGVYFLQLEGERDVTIVRIIKD